MATTPTPETAAKEILRILVQERNLRAGHFMMRQWLILNFNAPPWQQTDLSAGLDYAVKHGWLTSNGKLTEAGFAAAP